MLVTGRNQSFVEARCPRCGTQERFERFTSRLADGRVRTEPANGQWLPCHACGEWSPLEERHLEALAG
jgi:hypothetical protein